jgi:hypothetical protein
MIRLRKDNVLARLKGIKADAEQNNDSALAALAIIALLLEYNNDPDIRAAVDEIPF